MEQSTALTVLGFVFAFAFSMQAVKAGGRRAMLEFAALALVIAAIGGFFVYRHRQKAREAQELVARRAEFESRIAQFAAKYNAVADWQRALDGKPGRVYTVEFQQMFVRQDNRPILVFALLRNISEGNGSTEVYLDEAESGFKLQLDCTTELAHSLMSDNSSYGFEVIAQIRSFEPVQAGEYSLAKGRCIDVMPVSMADYFELVVPLELEKQRTQKGG